MDVNTTSFPPLTRGQDSVLPFTDQHKGVLSQRRRVGLLGLLSVCRGEPQSPVGSCRRQVGAKHQAQRGMTSALFIKSFRRC